jgi:exonuclease SbcC
MIEIQRFRQTGECSAEVEFATSKGSFRCFWYQHRGQKQADGALQPPRRELAEAKEGGKILAFKANEVSSGRAMHWHGF